MEPTGCTCHGLSPRSCIFAWKPPGAAGLGVGQVLKSQHICCRCCYFRWSWDCRDKEILLLAESRACWGGNPGVLTGMAFSTFAYGYALALP